MKKVIPFLFLLFCFHKLLSQSSRVIDSILFYAKNFNSDGVIIYEKGRIIKEEYFGKKPKKIEAMSITKSVLNLMFGILYSEGKIRSLDLPVCEFFPEWKQGRKKLITIRHLMSHTSGLQHDPRANEISPAFDVVKLALSAELESEPGTVFEYNNKASNLLPAIAEKISGNRADALIKEKLFNYLGIKDFNWNKDSAGNPYGMGGLQIHPTDLVKIGEFVMNKGKWNEKQIITPSWFDSTLPKLSEGKIQRGLMWGWIKNERNELLGYEAFGHLGQYLFICPEKKLIVVRMISESSFKKEEDSFWRLRTLVPLLCQ